MRLLWYDDVFCDFPKLKRLRFAGKIFGKTSSPFLLNGTIRKHIGNNKYDKILADKTENSFYVIIFPEEATPLKRLLNYTKKMRIKFAGGQMMQI